MDKRQTDQALLGVSLGGFFLMSLSFALMGLEEMGIVPGLLFWGGLLVGVALQFVLAARRRSFVEKYKSAEKLRKDRLGLIAFGTSRPALIFDILLGVGFMATVLAMVLTKGTGDICYVFIAVTVFAFCLHCVLNGRIYHYIVIKSKLQQVMEQKRVNSRKEGEGEL